MDPQGILLQRKGTVMAAEHAAWSGFVGGDWKDEINVRDFIQKNYHEYTGDDSFLEGATERTRDLYEKVSALFAEERAHGLSLIRI